MWAAIWVKLLLRRQIQLLALHGNALDGQRRIVVAVSFLNGNGEQAAASLQRAVESGRAVVAAIAGRPMPAILLQNAGDVGIV
jgi:hypothetical protein